MGGPGIIYTEEEIQLSVSHKKIAKCYFFLLLILELKYCLNLSKQKSVLRMARFHCFSLLLKELSHLKM